MADREVQVMPGNKDIGRSLQNKSRMEMNSSILTFEIAHRLEVIQNNILREYGISHQQAQILGTLDSWQNREVYPKDLEKYLGLRSSTVTVLLQNLEKKGLVEKKDCEYDKRQKIICETQKAKELHTTFLDSVKEIERIMTESLTEEEKKELQVLLTKASENVRNYSGAR